jgi:hypothetical protein
LLGPVGPRVYSDPHRAGPSVPALTPSERRIVRTTDPD